MIVLGLTGAIGMGKTTTAAMFAAEGAAVYDADAAVHALYAPAGAAGPCLIELFPEAVRPDGGVDRPRLADRLKACPGDVARLESIVFPLLRAGRAAFLVEAEASGAAVAVLDVPLLLETGGEADVDAVVVVTASAAVQRERVLGRAGMDESLFALLSGRQFGDAAKRERADFVIRTDEGLESARRQVRCVLQTVLAAGWRSGAWGR